MKLKNGYKVNHFLMKDDINLFGNLFFKLYYELPNEKIGSVFEWVLETFDDDGYVKGEMLITLKQMLASKDLSESDRENAVLLKDIIEDDGFGWKRTPKNWSRKERK
jgi:hypothetical protein